MLLYAYSIDETQNNIDEIISQLRAYNYKLINRIVGDAEFRSDSVPFEIATILPQKNIEAFRHYYLTRKTKRRSLPIEKFELNHTEVGSFIIPISIVVQEDQNATIIPIQNETNAVLHEYLKSIETLLAIPKNIMPDTYAERIIESAIDSTLVRDFLGTTASIAKVKEKYQDRVTELSISSTGSPILDYGLTDSERNFNTVDLTQATVLSKEYMEYIEKLEVESDNNKVEEHNANIRVVVDNIDRNGQVRLTVISINDTEVDKPFKATSVGLTKEKLDQFAELFKNEGAALIRGDVTKAKQRMGRIEIDDIGTTPNDPNIRLF